MELGKVPGGSSRAVRLDPLTLPVRFAAHDAAADEATRHVELHRERVVVRRAVRGMRIKLNLPVAAFLGVAIQHASDVSAADHSCIVLQHRDPALSVPLFVASRSDDDAAILQMGDSWARVLDVPLLRSGSSEGEAAKTLPPAAPSARRRRGSLKARRPSILLRRKMGRMPAVARVHREHEIIARD
jgi:hypothetical protein